MNLGPVARTVRTLVEKGLLNRNQNPHNRRADLLSLTPAGQALLDRDPQRFLVARINAMSADGRSSLATALDQLLKGLFQDWKGIDGVDAHAADAMSE
jgi:DNA-binding MarR family transcriptional regulator